MNFLDFVLTIAMILLLLSVPVLFIGLIVYLRSKVRKENEERLLSESPQVEKTGLQITGLVLGIFSIVFAWVFVSTIVAALGILFSSVGMKRTNLRGVAIAGLITSINGFVISNFFAWVLIPISASLFSN